MIAKNPQLHQEHTFSSCSFGGSPTSLTSASLRPTSTTVVVASTSFSPPSFKAFSTSAFTASSASASVYTFCRLVRIYLPDKRYMRGDMPFAYWSFRNAKAGGSTAPVEPVEPCDVRSWSSTGSMFASSLALLRTGF